MSLSGGQLVMALYKYSAYNSEFPSTERRGGGIVGAVLYSLGKTGHGLRAARRGRRFGRVVKPVFLIWVFLLAALFFVSLSVFGLKLHFPGNLENRISSTLDRKAGQVEESGTADSWEVKDQTMEVHIVGNEENRNSVSLELQVANNGKSGNSVSNEVEQQSTESRVGKEQRSKRRRQHFPCEVGFAESVDYLTEPKDVRNFTQFSLKYVASEEKIPWTTSWKPRFGGHQTLEERERSFYATDQTLHCGFVKGPAGLPSTGFDLSVKDKKYMDTCRVVVSSCIFGNSDFLRRPTSRKISEFSKKIVCFVMFVDEQTLSKLSSDGHVPDDKGFVGLWRIVVVRNLPYEDMRRTGKVPKFLSHRLFPSARYSIWLDSKMRLNTDPMLILEYFLWRTQSEYAISNHYDRRCVWEEVLQNKRLNKYDHTAIDEQFNLYQSDGLTKFDPSDPNTPLPSYVPEGSFIVRAHTPMSNLFSCLWFNEVDRFTSRDQLSFAYTYLKLRRLNPDHPFYLKMFKDCERRALAKLFHHRITPPPPPGPG